MAELNKEFVVNLQGKDFVTFNGLMDLAHQMKLQSITTELVQIPNEENGNQCIMKAVATTEDGKVFEGYGDADPSNVNSMIARHSIRMAETRAKARALRDLTNVGMTAFEELGGEDTPTSNKPKQFKRNTNNNNYKKNTSNKSSSLSCSSCNVAINDAVNTFSMKKYGKPLCINCQKKQK